MSVRGQDVVFRAGGAVLERYGVVRRRTAPSEDVAETFTRASTALVWDSTGVLRKCATNVVRASYEDRDGDGEYETPTVVMEPALTQLVEFSIPGGSEASFDMMPLGVLLPNLSGEYGLQIENGDRFEVALPANFNPNAWEFSLWFVPQYASDDAGTHILLYWKFDSDNLVKVTKNASNQIEIETRAGGTIKSNFLTPTTAWASGLPVFISVVFNGTDATLGFAGAGVTTRQTVAITSVGTFAAGTYTLAIGGPVGFTAQSLGAYNLIVTGTTSAGVTARFAAGAGLAIATWLETYFADVVLQVGGDNLNPAPTPQISTYQGVSQGVLNTGFETNAANWTGSNATISRSTGAFATGVASLQVIPSAGGGLTYPDAMSVVAGRWTRVVASCQPVTSTAYMGNRGTGIPTFYKQFAPGSWQQKVAILVPAASGTVPVVEFGSDGTDTDQFNIDDVYVQQLAVVSPSTATKGSALPQLAGMGGAIGVAVATITTPTSAGIANAFDAGISAQGQKIIKLDTGASGTHMRRFRLGSGSGLNGLSANAYASAMVGLFLKSDSAIAVANAKIRFVDSAGEGTAVAMTAKGRWQWIPVQKLIANGATYGYFEILAEDGTAFATANDALYIAIPTITVGRLIPYPIANDAEGTVTKAVEKLSFDYPVTPRAMTVYRKFRDRGVLITGQVLWTIGDPDGATYPRVQVWRPEAAGFFSALHQPSAADLAASDLAAAPTTGDEVELMLELFDDGSVKLTQSLNGAAPTTSLRSAATLGALGSAWGTQRFYLSGRSTANLDPSIVSDDDAMVVLGTGYTLDELRAA